MRFKDDLDRYLYYISQIDYSYWLIGEHFKHNEEMQKPPIVKIVDEATGLEAVYLMERVNMLIELLQTIIKCKKKIGYEHDTERDKVCLKAVRKFKRTYNN